VLMLVACCDSCFEVLNVVMMCSGSVHAAGCIVELQRKCRFGDFLRFLLFISSVFRLPTICCETRLKISLNFHSGEGYHPSCLLIACFPQRTYVHTEATKPGFNFNAFTTRHSRRRHYVFLAIHLLRLFIRLSGQILLPRYLMNGLNNLDETYSK